jgi:uncharacterized protein (TIGR00369 family)
VKLSDLIHQAPDATTLDRWLAKIPFAEHLGMRAQVLGEEILFVLPANDTLIGNPMLPAVHGGVVGGFMEQAAALHLIARMEQPVVPKTINFSLDYLRPTRLQDTFAQCEVTRQGRQVANVAITAWQTSRDEPCATARAHFLIPGSE